MRKQQIPTRNVDELQALCNEAVMAEQREAAIAAALALPEAERYRLWLALGKEFAPPAYNAKELDDNRRMMYERERRMEFLHTKLSSYHVSPSEAYRMEKELEELQRVASQ